MQRVKEVTVFLYRHHFVRYLAVGGTTVVIDLGLLFCLHGLLKLNLAVATSVAYWVSICYNFALNRYWTFDAREKESLKHHLVTYLALLLCNYLFTVLGVSLLSTHISYLLAKMLVVVISMTWTYYIYKNYIFVRRQVI